MMCPECKIGILRVSNDEPFAACIACNCTFNVQFSLINRPTPIIVRDACVMCDKKERQQREIKQKSERKPPTFSFSD